MGGTRGELIKGYVSQLQYINYKLTEVIEAILSQSERPPIIILQGDHGSRSTAEGFGKINFREAFPILNAYYLPNGGKKYLYEAISPVNTFRVIFNHYLGENFELLEDKSYHFLEEFDFSNKSRIDVSEKVE
jgi:hypothetical protein